MSLIVNTEYELNVDMEVDFNELYLLLKNHLNLNTDYDLSVSLVSDEYIHTINKTYRNIDRVTDVISFAMLDNDDLVNFAASALDLGDIFISVETACRQAKSLNQSLEAELRFLFVHGLLHLLGYDHQTKDEEQIMFSLQRKIINEFNQTNNQ